VALYRALGLPVVPVALNSGLFWRRRSFLRRPGRVTVAFLPPIPPGLENGEFLRTLEERIETASAALLDPGGVSERLATTA
jgi:1-acyl-sn-glycerol-3-phosphate acyltransferase